MGPNPASSYFYNVGCNEFLMAHTSIAKTVPKPSYAEQIAVQSHDFPLTGVVYSSEFRKVSHKTPTTGRKIPVTWDKRSSHKLSFLAQSDSFLWWGGDSTGVSSYICLPVRLWCISGSAGHFGKFYTEIQVQDIFLKTLNNKVLQKGYMWKLIQPFPRFWTKRKLTRKCVSKVFI